MVDALGNLAKFMLLPGQRHDSIGVDTLLDGIVIDALIADKAFDTNAIRQKLDENGAMAVIPSKADRKEPIHSRHRHVPMAPSGRKLFRQNQRIPQNRNTIRQN